MNLKAQKNKILAIMFLTIGVAIGHSFPTLYQYIESLSGNFITDEATRTEILNSDITDGELMKAKTLNAKFDALNFELNDLSSRLNTLESSGGTSTEILTCVDTGCFAKTTGIAQGETVAREYIVFIESDASPYMTIVSRTTGGSAPLSWDSTTYPDVESRRLKSTESINLIECVGTGCFAEVTGVANGGVSDT